MASGSQSQFGSVLRRRRVDAGLTQEELAERAGISARSVSDLERGLARTPYKETVRGLADALALPVEERREFEALARGRSVGPLDAEIVPGGGTKLSGRALRRATASAITFLLRKQRVIGAIAAIAVLLVGTSVVARFWSRTNVSGPNLRPLMAWSVPPPYDGRLTSPGPLALAGDGNLYVVDRTTGRVVLYGRRGQMVAYWGKVGNSPAQLRDPGALVADAKGDIYVADSGHDRIEKFSPTGRLLASWGTKGSALGQFRGPRGVAVDPQGYAYVADTGNSRVQVLSPTGKLIGSWNGSSSASGPMVSPTALCVDAHGRIWVADPGNQSIQSYSSTGVSSIDWDPSDFFHHDFRRPADIKVDARGNVYVLDSNDTRVQKLAPSGKLLAAWETNPLHPGSGSGPHLGGLGIDPAGEVYASDAVHGRILRVPSFSAVKLQSSPHRMLGGSSEPSSLAVDPDGYVYVLDKAMDRVLVCNSSGVWLRSLQIVGSVRTRFVGPPAAIALDDRNGIYVSDYGNNHVLELHDSGRVTDPWERAPPAGELARPQGIALDGSGDVYVVNQGNASVEEFASNGALRRLWRVRGGMTSQESGQSYLDGLALGDQSLYVTDQLNDHILDVSRDGSGMRAWGRPGAGLDGLRAPSQIAVDASSGNVYVADTQNGRIQIRSRSGAVLRNDGSPGSGLGQFERPTGIATDSRGSLFVADTGNHRIEKLSL